MVWPNASKIHFARLAEIGGSEHNAKELDPEAWRETRMPTAQSILEKKGTDVATVDREAPVLEAAKLLNERRIGAVVITSS